MTVIFLAACTGMLGKHNLIKEQSNRVCIDWGAVRSPSAESNLLAQPGWLTAQISPCWSTKNTSPSHFLCVFFPPLHSLHSFFSLTAPPCVSLESAGRSTDDHATLCYIIMFRFKKKSCGGSMNVFERKKWRNVNRQSVPRSSQLSLKAYRRMLRPFIWLWGV